MDSYQTPHLSCYSLNILVSRMRHQKESVALLAAPRGSTNRGGRHQGGMTFMMPELSIQLAWGRAPAWPPHWSPTTCNWIATGHLGKEGLGCVRHLQLAVHDGRRDRVQRAKHSVPCVLILHRG